MMGRSKHEHLWIHVTKVENGRKWICKHCNDKFSGGASRIETHLGGKGGGIRRCSNYHANDQVIHNMASTSNNSQVVINRVYSTQDQGVNESGCNRNVFERETNQLKQLVINLECEERDIKKQLQWLESHGKKRKPKVDVWLEDLLKLKQRVDDVNDLEDIHEINELIQDLKQHKEDRPHTLSTEFVGKKLDFNIKKVLKLLDDNKVFVIGIYGMGGVGKTLLATLVENEVKRKTTFKDVFWITVSNKFSISKLQDDIAKRIGVKLDEDDERIRADYLSSALEKKGKSILILDDVWKYIDLEKVGIHPKVNGIKVIVTSRLKHVCHQMDCQPYAMIEMFPLSCYNEDEFEDDDDVGQDLKLFMLKLGHDGIPKTLAHEIEKIARCIVERFEGLPLGINVMARTMKGIDDIHQWKRALNKLTKLEMGQEVEEEVLKVLKRSYDNLMDKNLEKCFLYCALLSVDQEDRWIDIEELIMKLVDNGQINKNMCFEKIFDEANSILNKLEAHSLISLFHGWVTTHPLVRSMACYIMKESQRNVIVELNDRFTKIPLSHEWTTDLELVRIQCCAIDGIPEGLSPNCPKLSTLILNYVFNSHLSESFFKDMNSLTILDLSYNESLESLPNSITNLRSLVSLILKECHSLKHVPPLGELQALSRLVISNTSIEEPPQGLEKLINLKWLDLSFNKSMNLELGSFASYLTKLQYLDLRNTRAVIMFEDVQVMKMLECFRGAIDCKLHNQSMEHNLDMSFGIIKTYHLILGNVCGEIEWKRYINLICFSRGEFEWKRYINLISFSRGDSENRCIEFQDCDSFTHILPKDHTLLRIYKNNHWLWLCGTLSYSTSSSVRTIQIDACHQLESLFCLSGCCSFCPKIHNLEVLELNHLKSLTVICKDDVDVGQSFSPVTIFSCLKEIKISYCHLIEKLLTPQLVQQLQNLETITVQDCYSMKEIFAVSNNDDNDSSIITLPKLTTLELEDLPELKIVCKGSIRCGSSRPILSINSCPDLERHPTVKLIDCEIPYFGIFTTDIDPQLMLLDTLVNLQ